MHPLSGTDSEHILPYLEEASYHRLRVISKISVLQNYSNTAT